MISECIFVPSQRSDNLIFRNMNAFLITSSNGVSEWKSSFADVQCEMNIIEKVGVVSNVKVQKFESSILVKEFIYNYNGEQWEK